MQQPPPYSQQPPAGWTPPPQKPPARSRTPLYVALTVAVVVLAGVGGAVWFVGRSSPAEPVAVSTPVNETRSVEPSPTPTYDDSTVDACEEAGVAASTKDPGGKRAEAALAAAELSDVATLRSIANKYGYNSSREPVINQLQQQLGAIKIATWCVRHGLDYRKA